MGLGVYINSSEWINPDASLAPFIRYVCIEDCPEKLAAFICATPIVIAIKSRRHSNVFNGNFFDDIAGRSRLRLIMQTGVGLNHIDIDAAARSGITIKSTPGSNSRAVAEFVIGSIITSFRCVVNHHSNLKQLRWTEAKPGKQVAGRKVAIIGNGNSGKMLANLCSALGMVPTIFGRNDLLDPMGNVDIKTLGSLYSYSIVSLHLPLTDSTLAIFDRRFISHLNPSALIINTSRGAIVDEAALIEFLVTNKDSGAFAVLDVFINEGQSFNSKLAHLENVVLTPHLAGHTEEAVKQETLCCISLCNSLLHSKNLLHPHASNHC